MHKLLVFRQFVKNQWYTEKCQKTLFTSVRDNELYLKAL